MVAQITINPMVTTNAPGTFSTTLDGYMQGMAMDDPSSRNWLTGGTLDPAETLPMFGGVPVYELLSAGEPALRPIVKRSTAANLLTGISVFNQDHSMINTPSSPVPAALPGMTVMLYRFGSNARIPLAMDPALVALLPGLPIAPSALYWDPVNFYVTATTAGNIALPVGVKQLGWNAGGSMTVSFNGTTGYATWNRQGNCILLQI
jgi:hypothetical protein